MRFEYGSRGWSCQRLVGDPAGRSRDPKECDPPIYLGEEPSWQGAVAINPMTLREGEGKIIARELARIVSSR